MYTVDIHKYKENRDSAIEELKIAISFGKREKDHCVKVMVQAVEHILLKPRFWLT